MQRGAPAPLPHCGSFGGLAAAGRGTNEGRRRPSLIAAIQSPSRTSKPTDQRGAPAPLPHCGRHPGDPIAAWCAPTRGAGAPPSLRPLSPPGGGRGRAPTRGAGAPPSLRRELHGVVFHGGIPTRGAGAPPSLRPPLPSTRPELIVFQRGAPAPLPHCGFMPGVLSGFAGMATRGAGAPPSLRPDYSNATPGEEVATRGAGAPPSLRQIVDEGGERVGLSNEGRRRPSLIAA